MKILASSKSTSGDHENQSNDSRRREMIQIQQNILSPKGPLASVNEVSSDDEDDRKNVLTKKNINIITQRMDNRDETNSNLSSFLSKSRNTRLLSELLNSESRRLLGDVLSEGNNNDQNNLSGNKSQLNRMSQKNDLQNQSQLMSQKNDLRSTSKNLTTEDLTTEELKKKFKNSILENNSKTIVQSRAQIETQKEMDRLNNIKNLRKQ